MIKFENGLEVILKKDFDEVIKEMENEYKFNQKQFLQSTIGFMRYNDKLETLYLLKARVYEKGRSGDNLT
jgi:hypothetical protein